MSRCSEERRAPVRPKAPPTGYAKIHVYAGVARNGLGGSAAAVCLDDSGKYLGSSALVVQGVLDVATLEAIACREALSLADDLMLHNFIVASDSKQVLADIMKNNYGRNRAIIREITLRAADFNCRFIFEGQTSNGKAHSLAKFSHS